MRAPAVWLCGVSSGAVDVVQRRVDELERGFARDAALLHEAALALLKEVVKQSRGTRSELLLQDRQHFLPAEAFAVDDAVGLFELQHVGLRVAVAPQADLVEPDDLRKAAALDHDERRHILRYLRQPADHRQPADAADRKSGV